MLTIAHNEYDCKLHITVRNLKNYSSFKKYNQSLREKGTRNYFKVPS